MATISNGQNVAAPGLTKTSRGARIRTRYFEDMREAERFAASIRKAGGITTMTTRESFDRDGYWRLRGATVSYWEFAQLVAHVAHYQARLDSKPKGEK